MSDETWNKRLERLESRLRQEPDNGLLWVDYGDFLEEECDNPSKVVYAFERARQLLPTKDLRLRLGSAHVRAGETEKGISLILDSIADNPRVTGYCFLADAYLRSDMSREAKSACQKAIDLDPDFEEAYYLLGEATKHESREEAIECYRQAITLDPEYQLAWQALGRELGANKEAREEGIPALRKAIELDPEDGWARLFLANICWKTDRLKDAEEQYRAATEVFSEYSRAYLWYAEFLEAQGRTDEALKLREKAKTCDST